MRNDLSTLSILHYVYGGIECLIGLLVFVILFGMGQLFQSDRFMHNADQPPPPEMGSVMTVIGIAVLFFLLAKGIANIVSGRLIARCRGRVFSQVVAGVNCLNIPLGIALGIFTFVELNKEPVKKAYGMPGVGG